MSRILSVALTMIVLSLSAPISAQTPPNVTPTESLMTYFNALNQRDYVTAYGLRAGDVEPFIDFVAGFRDTTRIEPYLGAFQVSNRINEGRVPAVLLGHQTNGTIRSFAGCLMVGRGGDGIWRLGDNTLRVISETNRPTQATLRAHINNNCYNPQSVNNQLAALGVNQAAATLQSYFDAINAELFAPAYALWLAPVPGAQPNGMPATDYRRDYGGFLATYGNTRFITAYFGAYQFSGAVAGRPYLDGMQPVVLVSQDDDGTIRAFSGCFVMGRFFDGRMGIVNRRLDTLAQTVPNATAILDALNVDCASLGIAH